MKISKPQMDALARSRRGAYLTRVREDLQQRTGRFPDEATLSWLFDRGQQFGFVSERQLAGYILLAWACGCKPGEVVEPEWMAAILADPHRTADDKLDALFALAEARESAAA